jgi:hypothetical protein
MQTVESNRLMKEIESLCSGLYTPLQGKNKGIDNKTRQGKNALIRDTGGRQRPVACDTIEGDTAIFFCFRIED